MFVSLAADTGETSPVCNRRPLRFCPHRRPHRYGGSNGVIEATFTMEFFPRRIFFNSYTATTRSSVAATAVVEPVLLAFAFAGVRIAWSVLRKQPKRAR
jgi:hypothetical protein